MTAFIEEYREAFGVEPICRVLPIASSSYYSHAADAEEILRVHEISKGRDGARKIWRQLHRESWDIARCTVERLMKGLGLQGVTRGKKKTTTPDPAMPCPLDKVNRNFTATAPNQLRVWDFTYCSTWQGMVYVAFVVDVFDRKTVGWRRPASTRRSEALATAMTTLWPKTSSVCSRRKSSTCSAHGNQRARSNGRP
ncbi:hypothetical protein FIV00_27885 [Labrenzia sp. THAF82]|nr:hypothetical protein FIV00_27885 [Labrenzia sp. THAF82]